MKNLLQLFCLIFLLFSATSVSSIIVNTENDSFIDTNTRLEWLDFGINNKQSYTYIKSQMNQNGIYSGWRFATEQETLQLFHSLKDGYAWTSEYNQSFSANEFSSLVSRNYETEPLPAEMQDIMNAFDFMGYNCPCIPSNNPIEISSHSNLISTGWFEKENGDFGHIQTQATIATNGYYFVDASYFSTDSWLSDLDQVSGEPILNSIENYGRNSLMMVKVDEPSHIALLMSFLLFFFKRKKTVQ